MESTVRNASQPSQFLWLAQFEVDFRLSVFTGYPPPFTLALLTFASGPMEVFLELQNTLQGLQRVRYSELIASMIIIYDHAITLDSEINLIWKAKWSFGKFLFLLNRYYTLFVVIFNNYVLFGPGVTSTVYIGLNGKEQPEYWRSCLENLRLLALYNLNRRVLAFMACTFAVALVTSTSIMAVGLSKLNVISIPIHLPNISVSMCTVTNLDSVSFFYAFWIPIMVSESFLCALVVIRAVERMREHKRARMAFTRMENGRELVMVLIRDSILYFLVLFAVYLTNTILFLQNNVIATESAISYAVALSCVMGSRLCLNVRGMISASSYLPPSTVGLDIASSRPHPPHSSYAIAASPSSPSSGSQRWPAMAFSRSIVEEDESRGELTQYELTELRDMKPEV
ncbi:hypothetical protein BC835DRAFT_1412153 [Cytidiella melzeri]|nr:hypothetical protein BC835DRAFT_1412153 [Cytidiella melzeri]